MHRATSTCFAIVIGVSTCHSLISKQVHAQIAPPITTKVVENDSMMVVKCGLHTSSAIPSKYEHQSDFPTGSKREEGRAFGAYVVANKNDSNFDGTPDFKQHNVANDPDLIEIKNKLSSTLRS